MGSDSSSSGNPGCYPPLVKMYSPEYIHAYIPNNVDNSKGCLLVPMNQMKGVSLFLLVAAKSWTMDDSKSDIKYVYRVRFWGGRMSTLLFFVEGGQLACSGHLARFFHRRLCPSGRIPRSKLDPSPIAPRGSDRTDRARSDTQVVVTVQGDS